MNPSGRLALTWYTEAYLHEVGSILDYSLANGAGRTYRFLKNRTLADYWFGYGLSYTAFVYSDITAIVDMAKERVTVTLKLTNTGDCNGAEVVQVYCQAPINNNVDARLLNTVTTMSHFIYRVLFYLSLSFPFFLSFYHFSSVYVSLCRELSLSIGLTLSISRSIYLSSSYTRLHSSVTMPRYSLCAFYKKMVLKGQSNTLTIQIPTAQLASVDANGAKVLLHGRYTLYVGGNQPQDPLGSATTHVTITL